LKRFFLDTPDGQIHYRVTGSGEPSLVLLHQTPRSSDEYLDVMPLLAKKRRVVAMDTIGYGDSDKPPKWYTIQGYAQTVIMLMDGLDIEKAVVVGHHTGSKTAIEVAASFPQRVDKLVLVGPYYWKDEEKRHGIAQTGNWAEEKLDESASHLMNMWKWCRLKLETRPDIVNRKVLDNLKAGVDSAHRGHWASASYPQEKRLPLVRCPTLIIWGTKDIEWHDEIGFHRRGIAEAIAQCRIMEVPGGSRELPCEMPQQFASLVLDFIE